MPEAVDIVITATDKASGVLNKIVGGNKALAGAIGIAATAAVALTKAMDESIKVTVKYADDVRKLANITNQTVEETSRMIQVMDDYKLSTGQATTAARMLSKEGLSLNIETLGKLSDEYKKLNTGQERSQFLMKNFGRAGQEFALMMDQGSDAIKKQGDLVNKGLILTQKQITAARNLEIAQDNLNDTQQALSVTVGNKLIPVWSQYLNSLNDVLDGGNLLNTMWGNFIWTLDQVKGRGEMNITTLEEMATAQSNAYKWQKTLNDEMEEVDYSSAISAGGSVRDMWIDVGRTALIAGQEMRGVTGRAAAEELLNYERSMGLITEEVYNAKMEMLDFIEKGKGLTDREVTWRVNMEMYGFTSPSEMFSEDKPKGGRVGGEIGDYASGGHASGLFWTGDSPSGLTPHSELVYAPGGAYVYNASQSRSMTGAPRAFTGGTIPGTSSETNLSSSTIRQLASAIAGEMARMNG